MTTIYVPQVIETAEQAEALPDDTIAYLLHDDGFVDDYAIKEEPGIWARIHVGDGMPMWSDETIARAGFIALVPIEVEVEQLRESGGHRRSKTIYVTPWEDDRC